MALLRFIGIDIATSGASTLARPGTDDLLIDSIRPTGGASGPLVVNPIAQVTGGNNLLRIEDGNSTAILNIDVTGGVGSTTLEGDLTVTGNLTVTGANTVSGGPSTVNTDIEFGDDATDTVTFARSWIDGTDLSYSSVAILDPGGTPTFGSDGALHVVAGTGIDPTTNGTDGTYNPPSGSLMLQTDGTAWIKTGAGATAWSQLASAAGSSLQTAYNVGQSINTDSIAAPVAISNTTTAGTHDLLTLDKSPSGSAIGDALNIIMGANSTGSGINLTAAGGGIGLLVQGAGTGTGNVVEFRDDNADDIFFVAADGDVRIKPGTGQLLFIDMEEHAANRMVIELDNQSDSYVDITKAAAVYGGFGTTSGSHLMRLQNSGAGDEADVLIFEADPNGQVSFGDDGSIAMFDGNWYIKDGDSPSTVWDQIVTASSPVGTLQTAYDNGEIITITDADGSVEITDTGQTADAQLLNITKVTAGNQSITGITLTGAGAPDAIFVDYTGAANGDFATGFRLRYPSGGTSGVRIDPAGLASDRDIVLATDNATTATGGYTTTVRAGNAGGSGFTGGRVTLEAGNGSANAAGGGGGGGFVTLDAGTGADASGANFAGGGGTVRLTGGAAGAAVAAGSTAGLGGGVAIIGGEGGAGTATIVSGDGGDVDIDAGGPGTDGGGGSGIEGYVKIAAFQGRYIGMGTPGTGADGFLEIDPSRTATQGAIAIRPYNTGAGQTSEIRFLELTANGTSHVGFKAPDSIPTDTIWTLPDDNSAGFLTNPGDGELYWSSGHPTDIYVAVGIGSDANDGLTPGTSLATLDEAIRRLNQIPVVYSTIVVHLNSGVHVWGEQLREHILQQQIIFYGDGAGQGGDDGRTVLSSGTIQAGSTPESIVTPGGLTVNQYQGKTIEITSGALSGWRRLIRNHDTATVIPTSSMEGTSANFSTGDSYRIVEPAVVIAPRDIASFVTATTTDQITAGVFGCGRSKPGLYYQNNSPESRSYVSLVNLNLDPTSNTDFFSSFGFLNSSVSLYGCEFHQFTGSGGALIAYTNSNTVLLSGLDFISQGRMQSQTSVDLGISSDPRAWGGWGSYWDDFFGFPQFTSGSIFGSFVCPEGFWLFDVEVFLMGGYIGDSGSPGSSLIVEGPNVRGNITGSYSVSSSFGVPLLVENTNSDDDFPAFLVAGGANVHVVNSEFVKNDGGPCISAEGDGSGFPASPSFVSLFQVTLTGGTPVPTHALVAVGGSQISFDDNSVTATGFTAGTECAIRIGDTNGTIVEQADLSSLSVSAILPLGSDGRHGFIRPLG